jgi:hypothetical protein
MDELDDEITALQTIENISLKEYKDDFNRKYNVNQ